MNEDYLWDKSGDPDPQIQQLEEILGSLRYEPRPLELPRELVTSRQRSYVPLLAIAAMLIVALLTAALWLAIRSSGPTAPQQAVAPKTAPPTVVPRESPAPEVVKNEVPDRPFRPKSSAVPVRPRPRSSETALTPQERKEAEAAKEQLMLALRVASEKLNEAQRRVQ